MGYVTSNLLDNEDAIYFGKVHWFVFIPGVLFAVIGYPLMGVEDESGAVPVIGGLLFVYGLIRLLDAIIKITTTELAITSRRVIAKTGFIRRNTVELNHGKVESFNVDQGIIGRLMGFGTIVINGTGGGRTPIDKISNPLEFRRQAMAIIDSD